ncbi:Mur ligase domain-containing protein, partial [bacterium]|nr:Mur ligase domain-containing protein [bacterium]
MPNHALRDLLQHSNCYLVSGKLDLEFNFLHFDSRLIEKNCGFLAMQGESLDGHDYIEKAIKNGATVIIAQKEIEVPDGISLVLAKNPLKILQDYATWYRENKLKAFIITITGSIGKTST